MRLMISPAKKMNIDTDSLLWRDLPLFLEQTEQIYQTLKKMSAEALQQLWKCNDNIAKQNISRLQTMNLRQNLTPAILAYEGIQYQYMAPTVLTHEELEYLQEHLRILSGFYGMLCPFDGVTPYRLEMQSKLAVDGKKDLYAFWGNQLAQQLFKESDCIVNLASNEYSKCIFKYRDESIRWIDIGFGEKIDGKIIEKGTLCKMARGAMVRFCAEYRINNAEEIKNFSELNYCFSEEDSTENRFVFLQTKTINKICV